MAVMLYKKDGLWEPFASVHLSSSFNYRIAILTTFIGVAPMPMGLLPPMSLLSLPNMSCSINSGLHC